MDMSTENLECSVVKNMCFFIMIMAGLTLFLSSYLINESISDPGSDSILYYFSGAMAFLSIILYYCIPKLSVHTSSFKSSFMKHAVTYTTLTLTLCLLLSSTLGLWTSQDGENGSNMNITLKTVGSLGIVLSVITICFTGYYINKCMGGSINDPENTEKEV